MEEVNKSSERIAILKKIDELEREGKFDVDPEIDPPTVPLKPGEVDFLRKKLSSKIKAKFADKVSFAYFNNLIKKGVIVIDGYEGLENLKNLKSGAIVTANHFNPFDSIPIHKVFKKYQRKRQLYKIIREGNYNFPGLFGFFMKHCYTLPLSDNFKVMKECMHAVDTLLQEGKLILVYAEQSLWWNYRKPKPLKDGAFRFAAKNNVPILPTFTTMRDTDKLDENGFPIQAYTLHILEPIYTDSNLSLKENVQMLKNKNEEVWKELYEKVYGIPLTYLAKESK